MAAIIAQMAAASRERKKRQVSRTELPPSKSAYVLHRFDPCYDPRKHNRYVRKMADREDREKVLEKVIADKREEERSFVEDLEEKRWSKIMDRCREKVDPGSDKPEEDQISDILEEMEEDERRSKVLLEVTKAFAGIVFLAVFTFVLGYIYMVFDRVTATTTS